MNFRASSLPHRFVGLNRNFNFKFRFTVAPNQGVCKRAFLRVAPPTSNEGMEKYLAGNRPGSNLRLRQTSPPLFTICQWMIEIGRISARRGPHPEHG